NDAPLEAAGNALEKALEGYYAAQDATGLAQRAFDRAASAYDGVGTLQDEFDVFNQNFTSRIEDVENWEIGSRNYALNSDDVIAYKYNARYSYGLSDKILDHPQTQFAISFDMKYTGTGPISRVEIYLYNGSFLSYAGGSDSGNRENTAIGSLKNDGDWARYS